MRALHWVLAHLDLLGSLAVVALVLYGLAHPNLGPGGPTP